MTEFAALKRHGGALVVNLSRSRTRKLQSKAVHRAVAAAYGLLIS
jgi:hypothetical protein